MIGLSAASLGGHQFLRGMRIEHLERLAVAARYEDFPAGHRLFEEGRRADRCWLLQSGRVAIDARVPGRGTVLVETLMGGTVLGWSWLFPPYRWRFGAVAATAVRAIALDTERVRAMCESDPELGFELHRRMTAVVLDRLQSTRARLINLHTAILERSGL